MAAGASRDRIVQAAIRLIAAQGYRETTVGDIEAAAGLTRRAGGFYRHFASKERVLVEAVRAMADEMIAGIRAEDIVALKSIRAELIVIARAILSHAQTYRPLRLILQREGHRVPALRAVARQANAKLASQDVVPWIEDALRRSRIRSANPRELGLLIFGPVLLYMISVDRGDPAFGLGDEKFLERWADHWAAWFARKGRD